MINTMGQNELDKLLIKEVDTEIIQDLDQYLDIVRKKSNALGNSLERCFENARKSMRYVLAYNIGKEDKNVGAHGRAPSIEKYLEDHLKEYFEKNDFMHYREFVRLNRACAIEVGPEVSSKIKNMYNEFFFGKRLVKAYEMGRESGVN